MALRDEFEEFLKQKRLLADATREVVLGLSRQPEIYQCEICGKWRTRDAIMLVNTSRGVADVCVGMRCRRAAERR